MNPLPVPISSTSSVGSSASDCSIRPSTTGLSINFAMADRNRQVGIGERAVGLGHERLARHLRQDVEHAHVEHVPGTDLLLDHVFAGLGVIVCAHRSVS